MEELFQVILTDEPVGTAVEETNVCAQQGLGKLTDLATTPFG